MNGFSWCVRVETGKNLRHFGNVSFNPLDRGTFSYLLDPCLLATLRKNEWIDFHEIFRMCRTWHKDTRNNRIDCFMPDAWLASFTFLSNYAQRRFLYSPQRSWGWTKLRGGGGGGGGGGVCVLYWRFTLSVRPSVRLSVCLSVRPSVRRRYPDDNLNYFHRISIFGLCDAPTTSVWSKSLLPTRGVLY